MSRKARREKRQRAAQKNYEKIQDERLEKLRLKADDLQRNRNGAQNNFRKRDKVEKSKASEIDWSQGWKGYLSQRENANDD